MNRILFLGDIFYDYAYINSDIEDIIRFIHKNNYKCIINLEGSLFSIGEKIKKRGPNLVQSPILIDILKRMNVIGVCLANNHIMDYGDKSLLETINLLEENGIKHCGAGRNLLEAAKPMSFKSDFGILNVYNYGWNVEETVYAKKNKCGCAPRNSNFILYEQLNDDQINVCSMHWGFEFNTYPMPFDIDLGHKLIDHGYDLIIGHHSHVIQSKELYNGRNIYYSLGNFYFSSRRDAFISKKYDGNVADKSSYGLGVVFDLKQKKVVKEIFFYYDNVIKKTIIKEKLNSDVASELLTDITNIKIDKDYINKIRHSKRKRNPILTNNLISNFIKIKVLLLLYSLLALYKKGKKK